jgi:hypothetical protein
VYNPRNAEVRHRGLRPWRGVWARQLTGAATRCAMGRASVGNCVSNGQQGCSQGWQTECGERRAWLDGSLCCASCPAQPLVLERRPLGDDTTWRHTKSLYRLTDESMRVRVPGSICARLCIATDARWWQAPWRGRTATGARSVPGRLSLACWPPCRRCVAAPRRCVRRGFTRGHRPSCQLGWCELRDDMKGRRGCLRPRAIGLVRL